MSAEWAEQPVPDNQGIPGKTLAAQREAMGWTVEQVADQLKLAVRQVVALEAGDYANLPGPAVVRGFIRAYAKVVKLDAAPLVAQIALETPAASDATNTTVRRDKPATFSQVRFPTNGKRTSKFPVGLALIAALVAGGVGAGWYFGITPESLMGHAASVSAPHAPVAPEGNLTVVPVPAQDKPVAADPAAAKPADALPPVISNSVPLISVPPQTPATTSAPGTGSPAGIAPAVVTPPAAASVAAAPAAAPDALVLVVREDSWVEVRPAKGRALFSGMVKGGSTETFTVTEPVTLIVGKPTAVDATLRGAALALPTAPGVRVARINIK